MQKERNQDVDAALLLLRDTLKEEVDRIFKDGATAMQAHDVKTAQAVLDFNDKLDGFLKKVDALHAEWAKFLDLRDAISPAAQKIVAGPLFGTRTVHRMPGGTRKVESVGPKTNLFVRFPDGTVFDGPTACKNFVGAIEKIGPERVAELGLVCCGEPLVSKTRSVKYPTTSHPVKGGYFVHAYNSTETKVKFLQTISVHLGMKLGIEVKAMEKRATPKSSVAKGKTLLEPDGPYPVARIAIAIFRELFRSEALTDADVDYLRTAEGSRKLSGAWYKILVKLDEPCRFSGTNRAYVPGNVLLRRGKESYRLSSQWHKEHYPQLMAFAKEHGLDFETVRKLCEESQT